MKKLFVLARLLEIKQVEKKPKNDSNFRRKSGGICDCAIDFKNRDLKRESKINTKKIEI